MAELLMAAPNLRRAVEQEPDVEDRIEPQQRPGRDAGGSEQRAQQRSERVELGGRVGGVDGVRQLRRGGSPGLLRRS